MIDRRFLFTLVPASCLSLMAGVAQAQRPAVRFDRDIRPVLSDNCFHCHGPDEGQRQAELRLDLKADAFADRDGPAAFRPGDPVGSAAWQRITSDDPDLRMPPPDSNKQLTPPQIALIKQWLEQGADWTEHWAFVAPQKPPVPTVKRTSWPRGPIDHFVLARLEQEALQPAAEADRRTLIRRLSFDLTGLPPEPADVERFVADASPSAYERVVERLLASRHYGERMALMWLDAARYGDTSVYHADGPREMWAWRDRIVQAYNENQPFDQFSIDQLAGDLLPDPSIQQQVASGFNRNNGTTDEGGAIAEEYRVEYAVDRVKTTSTVWLGLTMECCQCHEHKYDPISQEDYYRFFAFFNVSADGGMQTRGGNAQPLVQVPDPAKQARLPALLAQLAAHEQSIREHEAAVEPEFRKWVVKKELEIRDGSPSPAPAGLLLDFPLNEGQGSEVADASNVPREGIPQEGGQPRKGRVKGKSKWVATRFDQGLELDGATFVDLGNVADFERTDSFSYGGWVRTDAKPSGALLARMDDPNAYRGYDLLLSDGFLEVHLVHNWPTNAIKVRTKKRLAAGKWQHLLVTYDGSSKAAGVTIYVDGQPWEWNIEQDGLSDSIRTDKPLFIGSRHTSGRLKGVVDQVYVFGRALDATEVQTLAMASPLAPILSLPAEQRTAEQVQTLRHYFLRNDDARYRSLIEQQEALRVEEADLHKPLTSVMVMRDMPQPRATFILNRGSYSSPTDRQVEPGTPSILPPMPADAPRNRLGMARWLFDPRHPLTARVAVNRYWQMLFGTGLVATPEDFGSQGEYPSHPELLDWLAVDFRESGWNVKRMLKQIVMSAAYRQGSSASPELRQLDPENRLLARGPRFRLQGEFIRDNALAISGLLVPESGGPGVKPYQPLGLWKEVGLGGNPVFVQDHGDKLYRRSLYTYWKRSAPPPAMQLFDAPTREKCVVRRPRTNTPLQALVTLNDVQFVEAARHLAQRMLHEGGDTPSERTDLAYRLAVARPPSPTEQQVLLEVFQESLEHYRNDLEAAKKLLAFGESKRDESLDVAEHAAWTVVAGMILNLNETLTRG